MRWWLIVGGMLAMLLLSGCPENEPELDNTVTASLLVFRYDAARDVVIAGTIPTVFTPAVTPQGYASALFSQTQVSYAPSPDLQLSNPRPTVNDDLITVNYQRSAGLDRLAAAQISAVQAAWEAWWWVPDVKRVRVEAMGQPLATLGQLTLTQPMAPTFHTYVWQPQTGEVGYLVGAFTPANLAAAVTALQRREISEFPATQGFQPLLPPNIAITVATDRLADGVLPVDLPANFPREQSFRLAGIVLMLTQFPEVEAVRFTFGGNTVNAPFMLGNLNASISPYQLLLPVNTARVAGAEELRPIQAAVEAKLGHPAASYGTGLVWRNWATQVVTPENGAEPQTWLLRQDAHGYSVQASGTNLTAGQLQTLHVPREAITAFHISGWESAMQPSAEMDAATAAVR